jgi:O-antigen ligase
MISEATRIEIASERERLIAGTRVSEILGKAVFGLLAALIVFTAVPYGTAEAWWKAFFVCCALALSVVWIIDGCLTSWRTGGEAVLCPMVCLLAFTLLQAVSVPWATSGTAGFTENFSNSISADPSATRFFALQLLALILTGALLFRYATTRWRQQTLIHIIIAVAVVSSIFAILRQTTQHEVGFVLPLLGPEQGYGQFINKNHFAFLMEMALGLILGLMVAGGVQRERILIYFGALLPIWTALVLSNSRGGLVAMLAQVVGAGLLLTTALPAADEEGRETRLMGILRSLPARIAMIIVLVIGVAWGTLWLGGDRLVTRISEGQKTLATSQLREGASRNQMWRATWRMFAAHPIAGVGMAAYWIAIPTFHDASGMLTPQEAHNDYLELLASGGIIGAGLGFWFVVVVIGRIRSNLRTSRGFHRAAVLGACIGLIGVAVHSLVDFGLHMLVNAVVFTCLIVIATARLRSDHNEGYKESQVVG